jgi:hypothetical protein
LISAQGKLCDADVEDGGFRQPEGHCLIQHRSQTHPTVIEKAPPIEDHATTKGISLASQDLGKADAKKNATTHAAALDKEHIDDDPHLVHLSIFELPFKQVDRSLFWIIFALMLVFTIVVDRGQAWAEAKSEQNPAEKMFLVRINAELMMFGTVGLLLFILGNLRDLPHDEEVIVEFVDILCSMGACGLIAIAAILFIVRKMMQARWSVLEEMNLIDHAIEPSGPIKEGVIKQMLDTNRLSAMDYQIMTKSFGSAHGLPDTFPYTEYLGQTLVRNACDIMEIRWYSWLVILAVVTVFGVARYIRGTPHDNMVYIIGFAMSNWATLVLYFALMLRVNLSHSRLVGQLRKEEGILKAQNAKVPPRGQKLYESKKDKAHEKDDMEQKGIGWSAQVKFGMQILALVNSFLLSFYFMHLQYNLRAAGLYWAWRPFLLFPLLTCLFIMLPVIVTRFTVAEAYFSPDLDALSASLKQLHMLEDDFDGIRKAWLGAGKPDFPALEKGVDSEGLGALLFDMGIHIAPARVRRVFFALDEDKSDSVTRDELMKMLENEDFEHSVQASGGSTGTFSFRAVVGAVAP